MALVDLIPAAGLAWAMDAAERGDLPDALIRFGIRSICAQRAQDEARTGRTPQAFARQLAEGPVASHTGEANTQHYEVPTAFFQEILGPYLKYSACEYPGADASLAEAERHTLQLTCERAGIEDGQRILDLGCGWGSFTRYVAEHYPRCEIISVSNSATQRAWIESCVDQPGWATVRVVTADASTLDFSSLSEEGFDRVVSVEMFEHMQNWGVLFDRIEAALVPTGRFFMHVFCHRQHPYYFEDEGEPDWMARNFFSGGIMPSFALPRAIESALEVEAEWKIDGRHYARTLRAWLDQLDAKRPALEALFGTPKTPETPSTDTRRAVQRWRMFLMACEELFGFDEGREWYVGHFRLRPRAEDRNPRGTAVDET
ncbi:MAG: cyclopropane-fatty-acyl-phospholipid synthase family protein [Myxococcota bacterium]